MSVKQPQKLACWSVIRNRIWRRPQTVEVIPALGIGLELPAQVELRLVRILLLIQPVCRRLPHLHRRADERLLARKVKHLSVHEDHLTVRGLGDDGVGAILAVGRVSTEERAQNRSGGGCVFGFGGEREGDFVN